MLIKGNEIELLPEHSLIIRQEENILVAADLHLGKSAAFRAHGLPVPEGDTERDLNRLAELVEKHKPHRLVIAGDLFHAQSGQTQLVIDAILNFLDRIAIPFTLVQGNHDSKIKSLPNEIHTVEDFETKDIRIVHNPQDTTPNHFHICGHIHPLIKIRDGKNTSLRLPCFHLQKNTLTLPSFGSFTGGHIIKPQPSDRIFVTHMNQIIEVPRNLL